MEGVATARDAGANAVGCDPASFLTAPAFAPLTRAIYPEYLPDPSVLLCPSDKDIGKENDLAIVADDGSNTCQYVGLITGGDQSYNYLGYALDKVDETDPMMTIPFPPGNFDAPIQFIGLASILGFVTFNEDPSDDVALEADIDLNDVGMGGLMAGNGASDTIHRLREGIERYMITDINAPGSGDSQSTLPIMWDSISNNPTGGIGYNHVPGGANILYMDGHVDFIKYPDVEAPVNVPFASLVGFIAEG